MLQTPAHEPAAAPAPGSPAAALRDDLAAAARNLAFGWHPDLLDLVEMRPEQDGTVVRLHVALEDAVLPSY